MKDGRVAGTQLRQSLYLHTVPLGEAAVVETLELAEGPARRLQELGFFPGSRVVVSFRAPGGDPRVYRVDGAEIALRRETAERIRVTHVSEREHSAFGNP
jgi:Fe2+ transport system protein FeoA